jgi:hypothetical protein
MRVANRLFGRRRPQRRDKKHIGTGPQACGILSTAWSPSKNPVRRPRRAEIFSTDGVQNASGMWLECGVWREKSLRQKGKMNFPRHTTIF